MSDTLQGLRQCVLQVAESADLIAKSADLKEQVNHPQTGLAVVNNTMVGLQQQVCKHVTDES